VEELLSKVQVWFRKVDVFSSKVGAELCRVSVLWRFVVMWRLVFIGVQSGLNDLRMSLAVSALNSSKYIQFMYMAHLTAECQQEL